MQADRARSHPDQGGDRGSSAVEFALLLPILLLVLLALVQVGVLARDSLVLTQASRAGAREAAVQLSTDAVEQAVRDAAPGLAADRLSVNVAWSGTRGAPVTVSVEYLAPVASLLAGWLLPGSVSLSASATMRQEFA
ncbi:MAG TPA: TadE/TadG family type IV pilus assembly protein [Actinomycetota bacterium]|nr:TadE/TadG family type IV pilus assembly protein [Actinomycetota bacterium]